MRKTLADLRKVNTNHKLKRLIKKYELSMREVADHCMVSYDTATSWTVKEDSGRHRRMPNRCLELLLVRLGEKTGP